MDVGALTPFIGTELVVEDLITAQSVARFCATFGSTISARQKNEVPLGFQWCVAPYAVVQEQLGVDGHVSKGRFLPPVPLPRRMWAGGEIQFLAPLLIGDAVTRRSTIIDIQTKSGRSGNLCFVVVEHDVSTPRGPAIRERQDIVYREPTPALAKDGLESPTGSVELHEGVSVSPDAIQLFRYSALTFNGHRIHYDLPYATEVEGYAGLVVHGPLQATWLMNAAARVRGETPRSFTYRGVQPWIAGGEGRICVRVSADNAVECWTQSPAGNVAMSAGATW